MNKTIWIVNQYASHLEERHLSLAINFAKKGYKTIVITASFHHGKHEFLYDKDIKVIKRQEGIFYVYLKAYPTYQSTGTKRFLNMLDFCRSYLHYQDKIAEKLGAPEYVIASSAPPFMWEIGYRTVRKYNAKFIVEFRDIWPLALVEIQGTSPYNPIVRIFGMMEKRAYKRADAIVGTMPYAYKHVCNNMGFPRSKFHWMPNGLDIEKVNRGGDPLPKELDEYLSNHWCCIYIGSIVKSESVEYIIDAWKRVKDNDICLVIVGDGNESSSIDAIIKSIDGDRIRHFPAIAKEQINMALKKAQCCVAAHHDYPIYRFGLSMNKISDYLYSGKPVVFACNTRNIVKEAGGFVVKYDDMQAMADAIEKVKILNSEELATIDRLSKNIILTQYDYRLISDRYISLLESL